MTSRRIFGTANRPRTAAGRSGRSDSGVSSSVILRTASDFVYAPSFVTRTIELMSSARLPLASRSDRPTLDCRAENRSFPFGSQSRARFTALLHRLHTPSKSMIGRWSSLLNTLDDTAFGSRRSGVVSEMIRSAEDDDDDDDAAVENIGRCRRAAVDAAAVRAEETTAGGIEGTENAVAPRPKQRIISASDASSSRRNARRGRKILVADMKKPRGERNLFVLFFADGRLRSRSCSSLLVAAANSHPSGRSKISSSNDGSGKRDTVSCFRMKNGLCRT
mmetsp:Transcript_18898/g.43820  ORF Transcript_18898/g.43820 Transcript_18898/m.43820 type:complete len:277 (+) Transcript_18898:133-963(+)